MSAGKGDRPRKVDPAKYAEGYERAFGIKEKKPEPIDAARRKTFTGSCGEICPGFLAKEFLHGTRDDDPADLEL